MGKLVTAEEMYHFLKSLPPEELEKESQEVKAYLKNVEKNNTSFDVLFLSKIIVNFQLIVRRQYILLHILY